MKYILLLLITIATFSCKSQIKNKNNIETSINQELSNEEITIINEFLTIELDKDRYKEYKKLEIFVIEEALKKQKSLSDYEFNFKYKNSWGKFINEWILDSLQIDQKKKELENEEVYHWKESDFKVIKTKMLKYEKFRKLINSRSKEMFQMKPILYLSKPLFINDKNVFISFEIGTFQGVYGSLEHFTVLMRKINNKWIQNSFYEDGVFN